MVDLLGYSSLLLYKIHFMRALLTAILCLACIAMYCCKQANSSSNQNITDNSKPARLAKASREDKNGWIYLHLEGSPADIGYQHGYLAANEIDTSIQAVAYTLTHE